LSAVLLTVLLALDFWLTPNLDLASLGATTPERIAFFFTGVFALYWLYLVVQGYPISYGDIGSSNTHNLDNMVSGVPAIVALFGIFLHFAGFWHISYFNLLLAMMTLAVVIYDLWIIGGAASKINRLTDEYKAQR
jgi:hypothetical protein